LETSLGFALSKNLTQDTRSAVLKIAHALTGAFGGLLLCLIGAIIHQQAMNRPVELSIGTAATTATLLSGGLFGALMGWKLGRRKR